MKIKDSDGNTYTKICDVFTIQKNDFSSLYNNLCIGNGYDNTFSADMKNKLRNQVDEHINSDINQLDKEITYDEVKGSYLWSKIE